MVQRCGSCLALENRSESSISNARVYFCQTTNLIINLDHDEWILEDDDKILADVGLENETEVSFFSRKAYESFKLNPEVRWDTTS